MFRLSHDDLRTAWSHRTWEDFAAAPASDTRIAILPLHGFADHGLGLPLHLEEVIGSRLLRDALAGIPPSEACVLPPLRHVVGPYAACSFSVDPDTALALIGEIAAGVHAAGFRKLVLLSSSPWATELTATAALEARVALGLHTSSRCPGSGSICILPQQNARGPKQWEPRCWESSRTRHSAPPIAPMASAAPATGTCRPISLRIPLFPGRFFSPRPPRDCAAC
jgi:hypothetical protein